MSLKARIVLSAAVAVLLSCGEDATNARPPVIALRFTTLPASVKVAEPFTAVVELVGQDGERALTATTPVTVSLIGNGSLSGPLTAAPSAGLATFAGLRVSSVSDALQLGATSEQISATSPVFRAVDDCVPVVISFPVSFTGSVPSATCEIDGRPAAHVRFTKPHMGPLEIVVSATSGGFTPQIALMNEPPSDFISISGEGSSATGRWILPAAMYRLRIASLSGQGGAFTINAATQPAVGCVVRTLLPFALITYPERIDADDCFSEGSHFDRYHVFSPRPCTITMRGITPAFDSFLSVRNARTLATIAENDNGAAGTLDAFVMLTECRAGADPLEILAMRPAAGIPGDYALIVQITGGVSLFSIGPGGAK